MKIEFECTQCTPSGGYHGMLVEVEDDGVYVLECSRGHRTLQTIANPKFEILFEMSLLALEDGYTREAVATLAASLEEFFRLFVKAVLVRRHLYDGKAYDDAKLLWKRLDRSETQVGAFVLAYFMEYSHLPEFPNQRWSTFRNGVIHSGRIPKVSEVMDHGDSIARFLVPLYRQYRESMDIAIASGMDQHEALQKRAPHQQTGSVGYASAFQRMSLEAPHPFAQAMTYVRQSSFLQGI